MKIIKKFLVVIAVLTIIATTVFAMDAAEWKYNIFFNHIAQNDLSAITVNDTVYVPLRKISNIFGYNVVWDDADKSIDIVSYDYPVYKAVEIDGRYGYVNDAGEIVIEPEYLYAYDFTEGLGIVLNDDHKYGFINLNGDMIIDGMEDLPTPYKDGIAIARTFDDTDSSSTFRESKAYFIDKSGNMLYGRYFIRAFQFSEGFACVQTDGTYIPSPTEKNLYSYIDKTGNFVTDMKFEAAYPFENGIATVVKDGVKGTIDRNFVFTPDDD